MQVLAASCEPVFAMTGKEALQGQSNKYRLDNERECSMGYSVPSIDRMRGTLYPIGRFTKPPQA